MNIQSLITPPPNSRLKARIKSTQLALGEEKRSSALLISSFPNRTKSLDNEYPYHPSPDLFYLTGSAELGLSILITNREKRPILFSRPRSKQEIVWDGDLRSAKDVAKAIDAELIESSDQSSEILKKLKGIETLFFGNAPGTVSANIVKQLIDRAPHQRVGVPSRFIFADKLLGPLRAIKDKSEIDAIGRSVYITGQAIADAFPYIQPGMTESALAGIVELGFRGRGAVCAFNSIIATGAAAATLHYSALSRTLRKGEMVLIDVGASKDMYCGDLTRVFPVGGELSSTQKGLFEIVEAAKEAAVRTVRHGVPISKVHDAAAMVISYGLKELKLLKGTASQIFKNKSYREFFPHGIGHPLGLDVHDLGLERSTERPNNEQILKKGMVITIEPGIYLPKKIGGFSPCGIRLEDDVLVTNSGCEVFATDI